jgi:hypothetical protein
VKNILILSVLFLVSCGHFTQDGSRRLKKSEAPDFLKALAPENQDMDDIEFYKKHSHGKTTYKIKYELNDLEVSQTVSRSGEFIEKEEDLPFDSLPLELQSKINSYLQGRFAKYTITETERRTDKNQKVFIDVEVASSDKINPFLEISFDLEGNYVSEEIEHVEPIETLN